MKLLLPGLVVFLALVARSPAQATDRLSLGRGADGVAFEATRAPEVAHEGGPPVPGHHRVRYFPSPADIPAVPSLDVLMTGDRSVVMSFLGAGRVSASRGGVEAARSTRRRGSVTLAESQSASQHQWLSAWPSGLRIPAPSPTLTWDKMRDKTTDKENGRLE
jgi:hypothetical protein